MREFIRAARCGAESEPPHLGCHEKEFNGLALQLFTLQFEHNAPYRRFCTGRGASPESVTDWRQVPAFPPPPSKRRSFRVCAAEERTTVFRSSGTTQQQPSRHFHNADSLALYEASLWPWFERHLIAEPQSAIGNWQLAILTPPPAEAPHSSLVHMFETVRRRLGAAESVFHGRALGDGSWTLDFKAVVGSLQRAAEQGQAIIILGTAFLFVHLLDHLGEEHIQLKLPPGSRAMETGGYKGRSRSLTKPELHSLLSHRLGIPGSHIVCEYGMSELSSQAYDRVAGDKWRVPADHTTPRPSTLDLRPFRFPPWARVQIISPETGAESARAKRV